MKNYRKVMQFKFKNNTYNMYLDNKNRRFFLRCNDDGSLAYLTLGELIILCDSLKSIPYVMNIERDSLKSKIRLIPKVILKGTAVVLTPLIMMTAWAQYKSYQRLKNVSYVKNDNAVVNEIDIDEYVSLEDAEAQEDDDLVVDTYVTIPKIGEEGYKRILIFDSAYLDMVLDYDTVTLEDLKEVINNNPKISATFKPLLYEYVEAVCKKEGVELRVLYENLKTLEVVECSKNELVQKTLSVDSYGCYIRTENKIYVLENHEYKKGTWDYQVIFHELSHALRTGMWDKNGTEVRVQVEGFNYNNTITAEALNSIFAVNLFDYKERDVAYQLQSNYHQVFLECMDNYDIVDYTKHPLSYYAKKLDEFTGKDNYATVMFELIDMQYKDYHSTSIETEQSSYYMLYDYIMEMYFKKYITSDMSYEEAVRVKDELLDKILYDVPEEYNIDTNYFQEYLDKYCEQMGIEVVKRSR